MNLNVVTVEMMASVDDFFSCHEEIDIAMKLTRVDLLFGSAGVEVDVLVIVLRSEIVSSVSSHSFVHLHFLHPPCKHHYPNFHHSFFPFLPIRHPLSF